MKLLALVCENVRNLPDGAYAFTDARTGAPLDVAILTGPPASGKTTLLDAIAGIANATGSLVALPDRKRLLRAGSDRGRIVATWLLSSAEQQRAGVEEARQTVTWDLGDNTARPDVPPGLRRLFAERALGTGTVALFPADRRLTRDNPPGLVSFIVDLVRRAERRTLARAEEQGVLLGSGVSEALAPFNKALAAMLPNLRLASVTEDGLLRFARRDGTRLDLTQLTASESQGVLFALAFPKLDLTGSVVLIDEPELHQHGTAHARFLQALVVLGRDNQIVAATGSLQIEAAASAGQVIQVGRVGARAA